MFDKWKYVNSRIKYARFLKRKFGFCYALHALIIDLIPHEIRNNNCICLRMKQKHEKFIMNYLDEHYGALVKQYLWKNNERKISDHSTIWVFWWQGIENAPLIIQACIKSIKKHAGEHPVVILDQNNYKKYVKFPDYIMKKFIDGKITITHFSDLLRAELLYQYGGIWMDATLYITKDIDNEIYQHSFYTINFSGSGNGIVKQDRWTAFFLACASHNNIIALLRKLFLEYWKNEEELIVYLLIDYFLTLIYENRIEAKKIIDSIPISNTNIFQLLSDLNSTNLDWDYFNSETYIYKLSYKKDYLTYRAGVETIYSKILSEEGIN